MNLRLFIRQSQLHDQRRRWSSGRMSDEGSEGPVIALLYGCLHYRAELRLFFVCILLYCTVLRGRCCWLSFAAFVCNCNKEHYLLFIIIIMCEVFCVFFAVSFRHVASETAFSAALDMQLNATLADRGSPERRTDDSVSRATVTDFASDQLIFTDASPAVVFLEPRRRFFIAFVSGVR